MPGTLTFRPIEANLNIKDKDLIGKMDPYCLFHIGNQKVKSQVSKSGGQNPHWNDSVQVELPGVSGGVVQVDLKDKDMLVDDKLGTFELDLNEVTSLGQVRKWYPIFSKDRPAGEILIETTFSGSGFSQGLGNQGLHQGVGAHTHHNVVGGVIPTTTSQNVTRTVPVGGQAVLSEVHPGHTHGHTHHVQQTPYQGNYMGTQPTQFSGGQPLQFSGVQPIVVPVGGVGSGSEQYATEALMRGVDPLNTQQHYHYNVINGSTNPGYSGVPMNYSSGVGAHSMVQNPQSLTQTPLYSGSQPLNYEGNAGHAEVMSNTATTGHHNEGYMSKMQQKEVAMDQKFGTHGTHNVETKHPQTGGFKNNY